jgi:hypothetical protein
MLRIERRGKVSEKSVLRGIFGNKKNEETGGWIKSHKLHNEQVSEIK